MSLEYGRNVAVGGVAMVCNMEDAGLHGGCNIFKASLYQIAPLRRLSMLNLLPFKLNVEILLTFN